MSDQSISRRAFVGGVAAAGLGFHIVPRHVLGGTRHVAPSDTLSVACIGVGGMGRNDVRGVSPESVYALCDVDANAAAEAAASYAAAKRYTDFREMLDKEAANIDAVTVSTPDHTHAVAAMMALKLGKHVYCQKPLARTLWEVRELMTAAQTARVATQMGNQGHAQEGTRQIREWVEAGAIGTVREVHYWTNRPIWPQGMERPTEVHHVPPHLDWDLWLGPAANRPYHPAYAPFRWRGWWDFGTGALGDIACHAMDAAFWALELGFPTRVEPDTTERFTETAPKTSMLVYHFPARGSRPPVRVVWRDGGLIPPRPEIVPPGADWPPYNDGGQLWSGDDGFLIAGMYGQNPRLLDPARDREIQANPPAQKYPRINGVYEEWISACKGGPPAGSSFAGHAGPLTEMVLLGNLAVRTGKVLELDSASGRVTNTTVPEEYVKPDYRQGWSL